MDRNHKVGALLARTADDVRRLGLDELDETARRSNTWGSKEHREARDKVEKTWDEARRRYEALSDDQLDRELERTAGEAVPGQ